MHLLPGPSAITAHVVVPPRVATDPKVQAGRAALLRGWAFGQGRGKWVCEQTSGVDNGVDRTLTSGRVTLSRRASHCPG